MAPSGDVGASGVPRCISDLIPRRHANHAQNTLILDTRNANKLWHGIISLCGRECSYASPISKYSYSVPVPV